MQVFAIKFRNKGEKDVRSVLFLAVDYQDYKKQLNGFLKTWEGEDVDKRTISWTGNSNPFLTTDRPTVVYANLDELT